MAVLCPPNMYFAGAIKYTDREQDFLSQKSLLAGTEIERDVTVSHIYSVT